MPILGTIMLIMGMTSHSPAKPRATSLADALFSGGRQRVLGLLFGQPQRSYYANELIGLAGVGSGAVQRELARLTQSGLVSVRRRGNQKHYQANPEAPIHAELCALVQKTFALADPLRAALRPWAPRIRAAFVYGSVAKHSDTAFSDIDLMVLSDDLTYADVYAALEDVQTTLGRTINPTLMLPADFGQRARQHQAFVTRVLEQPRIWVLGGEHDLRV